VTRGEVGCAHPLDGECRCLGMPPLTPDQLFRILDLVRALVMAVALITQEFPRRARSRRAEDEDEGSVVAALPV
jgi:hypothetical protein